jgi:myo-inositol-1(or 4)-monophosphatase
VSGRGPGPEGAQAPSGPAPGSPTVAEDADLAERVARAAGLVLEEHFREPARGVRTKGDPRELVSEADLAADRVIRVLLKQERPDDAILTEEAPEAPGASGRRWLVDPLDGTTNFLRRLRYWCVSVAVEDPEGLRAAAIYDPLRDEAFVGGRGLALRVNQQPARVSEVDGLASAVVAVHLTPTAIGLPAVVAVLDAALGVRETGSTALDLAWVAAGRLDGCLLRRTESVWDWAGGFVLVEAGGGVVADARLPLEHGTIAAGPAVAEAVAQGAR